MLRRRGRLIVLSERSMTLESNMLLPIEGSRARPHGERPMRHDLQCRRGRRQRTFGPGCARDLGEMTAPWLAITKTSAVATWRDRRCQCSRGVIAIQGWRLHSELRDLGERLECLMKDSSCTEVNIRDLTHGCRGKDQLYKALHECWQ